MSLSAISCLLTSVAEVQTFFRDDVAANIALVQAAKIPKQE
jgi:hypothetical protein